tara:strand:+ start:11610 stop:12512 length:903 start_codon:yes stop_codon:yes gene_type:complete
MKQLGQAELKFYHELIHTPTGIPASRVRKSWNLENFLQTQAIQYKRSGPGGVYIADPDLVCKVLKVHYEIHDLDQTIALMNQSASKGEVALAAGHTKALGSKAGIRHIGVRACAGSPITLKHANGTIEISNLTGVLLQLPEDIGETQTFTTHPEVTAVICENQEDYQTLAPSILQLLLKQPDSPTLLFWYKDGVKSIVRLIKQLGISKIYHYGDFDLCGVQVFESNTLKHAPDAQMLFCEERLEDMISNYGNRKLYNKQLNRTRGFEPISSEGQKIAKIIRKHRKVIEQETVNQLLSSIK